MLGHRVLLECIPTLNYSRLLICRAFWQASRGHGYNHRNCHSKPEGPLSLLFSSGRKKSSATKVVLQRIERLPFRHKPPSGFLLSSFFVCLRKTWEINHGATAPTKTTAPVHHSVEVECDAVFCSITSSLAAQQAPCPTLQKRNISGNRPQ